MCLPLVQCFTAVLACQAVTQWYNSGHVGLGPSQHRDGPWLTTKHPQGPFIRKAPTMFSNAAHLQHGLVVAPTSEHHRGVLPPVFQIQKKFQAMLKVKLNCECFEIHHLRKVPHCWCRSFVLHVCRSWLLRFVECWGKSVSGENLEIVPLVYPLIFLRDAHVYLGKSSAFRRREERKC